MMLEFILSQLSRVPDLVWSALVASMVTLFGVWLSNRGNTKRLHQQLEHDSEQKKRDRLAVLQREVFLKAAEELARASSVFGKLPQLDPARESLFDRFSDLFAVAAKAQLIASDDTSGLIGELTSKYSELLLVLLAKATPIHDLGTEIRLQSSRLDQVHAQTQRFLGEIEKCREAGTLTEGRLEALDRAAQESLDQSRTLGENLDSLEARQTLANKQYILELLGEVRKLGPLQVKAMAGLRAELGLETSIAHFLRQLEGNWKALDSQVKKTLATLST